MQSGGNSKSSLEVGELRKILNRSKITPTHLFSQGEDSARLAEAERRRLVSNRSQSSGLINKKLSLMQKRRLHGGGSSQMLQYGLAGEARRPNISH